MMDVDRRRRGRLRVGGDAKQCVVETIVAVELKATVATTPSAVSGFDHTKEPPTSVHVLSIGAVPDRWPGRGERIIRG